MCLVLVLNERGAETRSEPSTSCWFNGGYGLRPALASIMRNWCWVRISMDCLTESAFAVKDEGLWDAVDVELLGDLATGVEQNGRRPKRTDP